VMDGKGRYVFDDGATFEGDYVQGQRCRGRYQSKDGSVEYTGSWKDSKRHGHGVFHQRGVQQYLGEWKQDLRHGEGKCVFADGTIYDGTWEDDVMHGRGKMELPGGEKYEGEFLGEKKLGLRHGTGTCRYDNGSQYSGGWKDNMREGKGKALFANGDRYDGSWKGDKRDGKGTCIYHNGDKYQGEWKCDKRHGYGVCVFKDKTKYRGEWEDDKWIQSSADPEFTRVLGPGLTKGIAGKASVFGIEAYDDSGNKRLCGGDDFTCYLEGPSGPLPAAVDDNEDGTYLVKYDPTVAGSYDLYVTVGDGELVADAPYPVHIFPGKPCAKYCGVSGLTNAKVISGEQAEFRVEVRDVHKNACVGTPKAKLSVVMSSSSANDTIPPSSIEAIACDDGTFQCLYLPEKPGFYRVEISIDSSPVGSSPYSLHVQSDGGEQKDTQGERQQAVKAVPDLVAKWGNIAQAEYAADGNAEGWDSDQEPETRETKEQKYLREHPDVAVVDNLEDIWRVGKYQRDKRELERKEKQKRLEALREKLEKAHGPPTPESATEAGLAALD